MNFKIDTKDVFHVISIEEMEISANMAAEMNQLVERTALGDKKNIVISLKSAKKIDPAIADLLAMMLERAKSVNRSFVVCELSDSVKATVKEVVGLDQVNYAPTESEAWDIIQMEEIERELDSEI